MMRRKTGARKMKEDSKIFPRAQRKRGIPHNERNIGVAQKSVK
jgi:hypothetical protein